MKQLVCLACCVSGCCVLFRRVAVAAADYSILRRTAGSNLQRSVHWMRNSAEFRGNRSYRPTPWPGKYLRKRVEGMEPGTWAVAIDADETLISNLEYEKRAGAAREGIDRRALDGLGGPKRGSRHLCQELSSFSAWCSELGGRISIVTNRKERDCPDTQVNLEAFRGTLRRAALPHRRAARRSLVGRASRMGTASADVPPVEIVMWLGDNINDFPEMSQESRFSSPEAFGDFGSRFFIFPNPSYGSWEANPVRLGSHPAWG